MPGSNIGNSFSFFDIYNQIYIYTHIYICTYLCNYSRKHDNIPLHMKIYLYIYIYIYILIFIDIFSYMQMGTCIFICNYKYLSLYMYIYIYLYQYCKFGGVLLIRTRLINIITPGHTHWHAAVQMNGKFSALGWIQYFLYWVGFGLKIDLDEQMHIFCTKTWENTSMPALRPWMSWGMVVL